MNADLLTGLLMAGVLVIALVLVTRPWWRRSAGKLQGRRAANIAAYRLRLAELETELAAGIIPADEAQSLQTELEARVLAEAGASGEEPSNPLGARRPWSIVTVTVVLAAFSAAAYIGSGTWRAQREIALNPTGVETREQQLQSPKIAAMVEKLAGQLQQAPDDPKGWAMLGRSYVVLQRYDDAAKAYAEANTRNPQPNPEWLSDEGEALAFADGRKVAGRATELFDKALSIAPDYGKALWYAGLGAAQAAEYDKARDHWQRLLNTKDLAPEMREVLEESMKTLAEESGKPNPVTTASATPSASESAATQAVPEAPAAPGLSLHVSLAPELASKIPAGATLFVFAKAASGPPIPLAVQRLTDAKLPLDIQLDDSMAMAPQLKLSQFEQYVVTARLSGGAGVKAQSGDLEGQLNASRTQLGGKALDLRIDKTVP
ncbi:MAG: c-type cytochrome biogenesis protein CcmI [Nevskia sp.]|jgi:cytochrome c-type biogenesis protein CcmH|nr:c-type cytochrome biogenesis protein CcmI [Nevskia sp.]